MNQKIVLARYELVTFYVRGEGSDQMIIRIFLADLTHDTVGLATEVVPLKYRLGEYAL